MTGIEIDASKEISYGDEFTPSVNYVPETTTDDRTVSWSSSDESVITVDENGKVKAVGAGTATLTATVGEYSVSSEVKVEKIDPKYEAPDSINALCEQKLSELTLPEGYEWEDKTQSVGSVGSKNFKAYFTPEDTNNYNVIHDIDVPVNVEHSPRKSDKTYHWIDCACGYKEPKEKHLFGNWKVTTEATYTSTGEKERECSICGFIEKESIPAKIIEISTPADLNSVRNNRAANYKLVKDIDMTATTSWTPISTFTGVFDGNGHSIIGLKTSAGGTYAGLFTQNNGTIKNLTLKDGKTSGESIYAGGICGVNYGNIELCKNYNSVSSLGYTATMSGGITGFNHGKIMKCDNYGSVSIM